jgi:hypothetical protein
MTMAMTMLTHMTMGMGTRTTTLTHPKAARLAF